MQIQNQVEGLDFAKLTDTESTAPKAAEAKMEGLANQNTFLQLLVAQIKNQDPLQPADGVEFLSQLAQFSQLEQLIGIRQELQTPSASDQNGETAGTTN